MQQPMSQPVQQFQSTPPARGATILGSNSWNFLLFQSTPPARGATYWGVKKKGDGSISIHAPREGGDAYLLMSIPPNKHFNPRPPRGGRLLYLDDCVEGREISIHAPREGGDYGYCITQ